jgi:hypothetical protein
LALPVADLSSTPATITASPPNDCAAFAIRAIDRAHEILVGAAI